MRKNYGYKYFSNQRKKSFFKKISFISSLLLIAQISLGGLFYVAPALEIQADNGNLCAQPADVVLIMDRSGSMDYASRCDWWQLKCVNPPSCSQGYVWTQNTTYNQTESWCNGKNQSAPHQSVYLAIDPKKIAAAKQAADNFLGLMGANDRSSLVSYADAATLDKGLSSDHPATKAAVDGLVAIGATNIGDAIKLAAEELKSSRANPQANHAMILLTDGLANKPAGSGSGENPADVAYAENQAASAAGYGFKIFTIGLGENGEINETMLLNIANTTGANYYHSPAPDDLQAIYNSIATRLCQYGSISGCKYSDINQDGNIAGEEKLAGWEIKLNNNENYSQLTDDQGCYQFSGLTFGSYVVTEGGKAGVANFIQTYPSAGTYAINLSEGENSINNDFGNYLPLCGNNFVDSQTGEVCEIGQSQSCSSALGYYGTQSCRQDCSGWNECISGDYCGDGIKNNGEECDGADGIADEHHICTPSCAIEYVPFCGDSQVNQPSEQCDGSAPASCTTLNGYSGTRQCAAGCIWAVDCLSQLSCGDGSVNDPEICDDGASNGQPNHCNRDCTGPTPSFCGNGVKEGSEECYDGNLNDNDGCSSQCAAEAPRSVCGNGAIENGELCDDGANNGQYGYCNSGCTGQTSAVCGNGAKEGGEECDGLDGVGPHQVCGASCALTNLPYCGDQIVNNSEVCDGASQACQSGDYNGSQACNSACDGYSLCQAIEFCGDGAKNGSEQCDDGNTVSGDGCGSGCQTESGGGGDKGSLKICKYEDADGLASTRADRLGVNNWNFNVGDGLATSSQPTLTDGCAVFSALTPGQYLINEESRTGWYYLEPFGGWATTTVSANQQTAANFYNARFGKIYGYEYADTDGVASTTSDRTGLADWTINLFYASATATPLLTATTQANGYFEFLNLSPNTYWLSQDLKASWINLASPASINLLSGETKADNNFVNAADNGQGGGATYCGDGLKQSPNDSFLGGPANNGLEDCDGGDGVSSGYTCNSQCVLVANQSGGGVGGGVYVFDDLILTNINVGLAAESTETSIIITWLTNKPATSRVIYDTITHPDLSTSSPPNYGYAFSTDLDPNKVTGHSVIINELTPGTTYYLRPLSSASPEKYGAEIAVTTAGSAVAITPVEQVLGDKITKPATGLILGQKVAAKPTGEVLGQKVTAAKPNGKVLADTGFKPLEFMALILILLILLSLIAFIKIKYLKVDGRHRCWLKKTLIFNQNLFIYQRADIYFKNR